MKTVDRFSLFSSFRPNKSKCKVAVIKVILWTLQVELVILGIYFSYNKKLEIGKPEETYSKNKSSAKGMVKGKSEENLPFLKHGQYLKIYTLRQSQMRQSIQEWTK